MRGTRWLLLVAIAAIVGGIGFKYQAQRKIVQREAPPAPQPLPPGLNTASDKYVYTSKKNDSGCATYFVQADEFKQISDNSRVDLTNVLLKVYNKECTAYNLIKSASAAFYPHENRLQADGLVEFTLSVPAQGDPKRELVTVQSSGVNCDASTGRVDTDKPTTFKFESGEGKATGAFYDPAAQVLQLKSGVVVDYHPAGPNAKPMKIEGASLTYRETFNEVQLQPWGKLTRDNTVVEGENVVLHLQESHVGTETHRVIQELHALNAHGTDVYPNKNLQYSAGDLQVNFDATGEIQQMIANNKAHMVSTSDNAATTVDANFVKLDYTVQDKQSLLNHVDATGQAVVSSKPVAARGQQPGETHVLRSDAIEMKMRPGGRDLQTVMTHAPGTLEFLPNAPAQHHRIVTASSMQVAYADKNRIENFHAADAKTTTDPNADEKKKNRAASTTSSKDLVAKFDPKTNRMSAMEQTGDFVYAEGDRHAKAGKATMDQAQNVILLDGGARMWDASGSTSAGRIRMDQKTGDFTADDNVESSRLPDQNAGKQGQMLSGDEPLQAQARHMVSTDRNTVIHYEGKVTMWQGANKITAEKVDLDRKKKTLIADDNVVSDLWEEPKAKPDGKGAPKPALLTVVKARHLTYSDADRQAVYSGGVNLDRPGMQVKSSELRAFLAESGSDSRLEKAFAEGSVQIVHTNTAHEVVTGTADHGEYYCDEDKVVLKSDEPRQSRLVKTAKGREQMTQAPKLTYLADDDRLLGSGSANQPVQTRIQRGRK